MTVPANLNYTDLQTRVMNSLRLPTTNTVQATRVGALINAVYRDVCNKYDWNFLEKRTIVNTSPKIQNGTTNIQGVTGPDSLAVTNNSMAVTFSSVIPPAVGSLQGWAIITPGATSDFAVYRIAGHISGTATATLDGPYTDTTNTASPYILYLDAYQVPQDVGKLLQIRRFGERNEVTLVGKNQMSYMKSWDVSEGRPQVATMLEYFTPGDTTTPRMLVVHPYPDTMYRMEVLYKQQLNTELSGTEQPFLPDEWRDVMWYGTMARAYPIFMSDQERGGQFEKLFNDTCALMVAQEKEYARDNPAVVPANVYRSHQPGRRSSSGMGLGSLFDRFPFGT